MSLILGQKMVRIEDGMKGTVALRDGVPRIVYQLMADEMMANAREKWAPEEIPRLPLRDEEIDAVAYTADQVYRSLAEHVPFRFWEKPSGDPFDAGLVEVIKNYLARP